MVEESAVRGVTLVTGGNSGIGYECVRALAMDGARILVASRDREASEEAADRISEESGCEPIEALALDLGSLASVRQFAKEIEARDLPIQTLICNAGLQMNGLRMTPDGFETTFAVNHLGHFLLVNLLMRRLIANAPSRVVVVASGVHDPELFTGMPKPDVKSVEALAATGGSGPEKFNGRVAYVNSKLCNVWFTYELIRRLRAHGLGQAPQAPLSVNAFEPGLVPGSGLARDYPPVARWIWDRLGPPIGRIASRLVAGINTAQHSGAALARVARDPALENTSGKYFPSHTKFREGRSSKLSYDEARAAELWDESVRLTELTADESPLIHPVR